MFSYLQRIGKAFMLPIALLPAAGLLLGIGGALSNPATIAAYPILDIPQLQYIFILMADAGNSVFSNLSLIMAIGLAVGLSRDNKGSAALAAAVSFIIMNASIGSMITISGNENLAIDTGVVGSLVIGIVVSNLNNRFSDIKLPDFLGFFAGSRFIPIISSFSAIFIGMVFYLIWPPIQNLLVDGGTLISQLGYFGTFLYGFLLRLTGAFGLHHMIYPLFWFTELGGVEVVNGAQVVGAQNIFFAQIADPSHVGLYTEGTRFFAGRFATMMFGLPGAAFAMYKCIPAFRRKKYIGLFFSVALTSFLTGITEPLEYMFLFVSPALYVFHAFLDGLSFMIADILNIAIGNTFSGGFIDFFLFGILQGEDKTHWMYVLPIGVAWFGLYYASFTFFIKKFKIATPGHLEDDIVEENVTLDDTAYDILEAVGMTDNIISVEACITRLRFELKDSSIVNEEKIKETGANGIVKVQGGVQIIYGAKAEPLAKIINKEMRK